MKISLDGIWESDYFLGDDQYFAWKSNGRCLNQMHRDCAGSSGFITGKKAPSAMKGHVPGCDRSFLLENGLCEDPYYGRNLEHTGYCEQYSWAFRRTFSIPVEWKDCRIRLDFARVDYYAMFYLNGVLLGEHANMSYGISFEITEYVKFEKENILCVVFRPAPNGLPNHRSDAPADFAKFHRTQIGFGWDWSRKFIPTGICDSVTLSAYRNVRLSDIYFQYDGSKATVFLEAESRKDQTFPLKIELISASDKQSYSVLEKNITFSAGHNEFSLELPLPEPLHLWYPNHYGTAEVYTLQLTLDQTVEKRQVGFKTIKMVRNPDSPEGANNLTFNINGKDIFVRGVNYVPADLMLSRVNSGDYEHLILAAKATGVNMFRIWGGGVIEKDSFYDLCDRYGIMVWQEFMHACSQYQKDPEFLAVKEREGEAILRKLRNHVCITLYCGGNELLYYGEIADSPMLLKYGQLVKRFACNIPYHISSPDRSRPGERPHGPWNYTSHGYWNKHFRLFASELGCNGTPDFDSLRRFIPEREIENKDGQSFDYHFFIKNGTQSLFQPVNEFFEADTMKQVCDASMFVQSDSIQYIMEHYRRLAPKASGCMFWQYNEPWPTCSWNLIDYYGFPKMAMYGMKRANQPVLLSIADESWTVKDNRLKGEFFLTSDSGFSGTAGFKAMNVEGTVLFEREFSGEWEKGTHLLADISENLPDGLVMVFFYLNGKYSGVRVYGVPDFKTAFELPATTLSAKINEGSVTLCNTGNAAAFCVKLGFENLPDKKIFFHDNYLFIPPGETREIEFSGDSGEAMLKISAWNIKPYTQKK